MRLVGVRRRLFARGNSSLTKKSNLRECNFGESGLAYGLPTDPISAESESLREIFQFRCIIGFRINNTAKINELCVNNGRERGGIPVSARGRRSDFLFGTAICPTERV